MPELSALASAIGLNGRGGAAFPLARKLSSIDANSGRRTPVVIVNASEGDPTSAKDRELALRSPHLILDGLHILADALGARRRVVVAHRHGTIAHSLHRATGERDDMPAPEFALGPAGFVASEASALVNLLNSGDARPLGRFAPIWEQGVGAAPTLVVNAETAAQLALAARFGPQWFAAVGHPDEPGTCLVTMSGALPRPGVVEIPSGLTVRELLGRTGAAADSLALVGGLAGTWVRRADIAQLPWTVGAMNRAGVSRGVGSMVVLGAGGCQLVESARILGYLAQESAGQCGPCMFGLPAIADDLNALVSGRADALDRLNRRLPVVVGRGGCAHPDGAVAMAGSALRLLTGPLATHLSEHLSRGGCAATGPHVPLPAGW